jgi:4-hydroxy-3-polyprenylbenzoate decarboxylase
VRFSGASQQRKPQELLTLANAILGQGQLSLAKYLLIAAHEDNPALDVLDTPGFFHHVLKRVDWRSDLHFQTCTTMDTLDYSGSGFNEGSKVVIAAAGTARRKLPTELPPDLRLPEGFADPRVCMPGILSIKGPACFEYRECATLDIAAFCGFFGETDPISAFPLLVIVDDSEFAARTLNNFLWVTFTRSNPASDIYGIGAFVLSKHWGCRGPQL